MPSTVRSYQLRRFSHRPYSRRSPTTVELPHTSNQALGLAFFAIDFMTERSADYNLVLPSIPPRRAAVLALVVQPWSRPIQGRLAPCRAVAHGLNDLRHLRAQYSSTLTLLAQSCRCLRYTICSAYRQCGKVSGSVAPCRSARHADGRGGSAAPYPEAGGSTAGSVSASEVASNPGAEWQGRAQPRCRCGRRALWAGSCPEGASPASAARARHEALGTAFESARASAAAKSADAADALARYG